MKTIFKSCCGIGSAIHIKRFGDLERLFRVATFLLGFQITLKRLRKEVGRACGELVGEKWQRKKDHG